MNRFVNEFSKYAGASLARQVRFADYLGDRGFSLDLDAGQARFGDDLVHPVQLIGLEVNTSWTWAWHNPDSWFDDNLFAAAKRVKSYGEQHSLKELTTGHYELTEFNGFVLAMFAAGICDGGFFYRCPTAEGSIYFLVNDVPTTVDSKLPFEQIAPMIAQTLAGFDVQHRVFAEAFLTDQGFSLEKDPNQLRAVTPTGERVMIEFDSQDRISVLKQSTA